MSNKNEYLSSALEKLYSKNEDFIIIGLTGRTGSGSTTAAKILATEKSALRHSFFTGNTPDNNKQRKEKILNKFYKKNWQPFIHLRVSSILTLMLLDSLTPEQLERFLKNQEAIRDKDICLFLTYQTELAERIKQQDKRNFYVDFLDETTAKIRKELGEAIFIKLYQLMGKNARRSGNVSNSTMVDGKFFSIADRIKKACKQIHQQCKDLKQNTYIAIDAIRNPLEASYFQERFASFYLLAISCNEDTRKERLRAKGLSDESIDTIDKVEYARLDFDDEKSFTDQDIQGCLQKADVYMDSNAKADSYSSHQLLTSQIIKLVSLAQKPGLITPSAEERCMQVAYTSKLNSGCLSRQVGAVVTQNNFSIKSVGWNDAPFGQVPCNLRSTQDLNKKRDEQAYSPFELTDSEFQEHMIAKFEALKPIKKKGYNLSYCFKSEYNAIKQDKNQVHTRSLHAEENAFLQISKDGGSGVEGGFLFTTASPCELCAKKAYQLGMTKIFYIDPYPGISFDHILTSGLKHKQPEMVLFNGAIGRAFHNLYTPIAAYKDELNALMAH
ncbi:deoxycytidylate deaminase [Vibrio parahaemolyticus]